MQTLVLSTKPDDELLHEFARCTELSLHYDPQLKIGAVPTSAAERVHEHETPRRA
jgi:hypothetical protein